MIHCITSGGFLNSRTISAPSHSALEHTAAVLRVQNRVWTQDVCLKLQQLTHEGQVRGDDLPPALHEIEGLVKTHAAGVDQVRQADGG